MSEKMVFELQGTSNAYGYGDIPESAWKALDQFPDYKAAKAAQRKEIREMHDHCPPGAWDSHSRIVSLRDTVARTTFYCDGPISDRHYSGWHGGCPDFAKARTEVPWPAGETRPRPPEPEGWSDGRCPRCAAEHQRRMEILYSEES